MLSVSWSWVRRWVHQAGSTRMGLDAWAVMVWVLAGLVLLPLLVVVRLALNPDPEVLVHLWRTRLPEMLGNTLLLMAGVGTGTFLLGTGLAWLVTAYRFPGRGFFDWALILPMAVPSYVLAYSYMVLFDYAGPVQRVLRAWFGPQAGLPPIRSGAGAVLVMTLTLYPYVYLLARAAFYEHASATFDLARTLGASRIRAFLQVVLPMARPSLVAGLSLVLMETLTEVGTVRFFNFPTLSDGIFRVWHGFMQRDAAVHLAVLLLAFALVALLVERRLRGRARYVQETRSQWGIAREPLTGYRSLLATAFSAAVLFAGFLLPVAQLVVWSWKQLAGSGVVLWGPVYARYVRNTWMLAGLAAVFAVLSAVVLAYGVRLRSTRWMRLAARVATLGYAVPGAVIGVGVLLTLSAADHALNTWARAWWGTTAGLLFTGSLLGLTYAYVVRFMAVAYSSVEASLEKISGSMDAAARILGASPGRVLWRVHLPLMRVGLLTAALLVFVDVMKELPITLLLRPFGYETLALWVWQDVSESLWENAALPALTIVAAGLVPVVVLLRSSTHRRSRL